MRPYVPLQQQQPPQSSPRQHFSQQQAVPQCYGYAPPIGTAHGFYKAEPKIRYDRMEYLVKKTNMPMVLHGGTGLNGEVYGRLIALGAAKVNIFTALMKTYDDGFKHYLDKNLRQYDPLKLIGAVQKRCDGAGAALLQALRQRRSGMRRVIFDCDGVFADTEPHNARREAIGCTTLEEYFR